MILEEIQELDDTELMVMIAIHCGHNMVGWCEANDPWARYGVYDGDGKLVPIYPKDLDAMHHIERKLIGTNASEDVEPYLHALDKLTGGTCWGRVHADARIRAQAWLFVMDARERRQNDTRG